MRQWLKDSRITSKGLKCFFRTYEREMSDEETEK